MLAMLAVLITGIPACIVVTPLISTIVLTVRYIVSAITPISPPAWLQVRQGALGIPDVALATLVFVGPGALAIFVLWLANRRLLRQVAVGHELERSSTRAPDERDPEERQLRNVVEEVAVAAGVQPPRLLIIDSDAVNAAAVGVGIEDASVLVTRGLLDKLDRDETQAVVGHVIGAIGNGDLTIASIIFSIYQTWGALALLMTAPFQSAPRRAIWRAVRMAFRSQRRTVDRWEAEFVSDAFLRGAVEFEDNAGMRGNPALALVSLPATLGAYVVRFAVFISSEALIGPIVAFMWRTRRHLADAMAVQLTRNPDALARALHRFRTEKSVVAQGDALSLLFFAWPATTTPQDALAGQFTRMHPTLEEREQRLVALGADPSRAIPATGIRVTIGTVMSDLRRSRFSPRIVLLLFAFFVLVPILLVVGIALSVVALAAVTILSLMATLMMLLVVSVVLKFLFLTIPRWIGKGS